MQKPWLFTLLFVASLNAAAPRSDAATGEEDRLYCLSDVCPGDPLSALSGITLGSLAGVAEHPREHARARETLKAAVPGLSDAERDAISAYTDSRGSLLIDARTLPIFLKIARICAPVGPFVALFTSESGHASIVEFGATINGAEVGLGVTSVARFYQVGADSTEERALIADLSRKFGFPVDAAPETQLAGRRPGVSANFTRQENGFRLAFTGAAILGDAVEFAQQPGCQRIKID